MKCLTQTVIIALMLSVFPFSSFSGNDDEVKKGKIVSSFSMETFSIKEDGFLCWTTKNEHGSLPYVIEQFVFDKWVAVAEVNGIGTPVSNSYSVQVILNSGENKFRVKQQGYDQLPRFSYTVSYYSKKDPVTYKVSDDNQTVSFSDATFFMVYNPYGAVIKQEYGNSINISDYPKGYYCLIYDNKLGGFEKKKVLFKNTAYPIVVNPLALFGKKKI